jgi:hypothetical protein
MSVVFLLDRVKKGANYCAGGPVSSPAGPRLTLSLELRAL